MSDGKQPVDLPTPCLIKPFELWSGKQLFNVLVRPHVRSPIYVNLELSEKIYTKKGEHMCLADGYVCFRNRCKHTSNQTSQPNEANITIVK